MKNRERNELRFFDFPFSFEQVEFNWPSWPKKLILQFIFWVRHNFIKWVADFQQAEQYASIENLVFESSGFLFPLQDPWCPSAISWREDDRQKWHACLQILSLVIQLSKFESTLQEPFQIQPAYGLSEVLSDKINLSNNASCILKSGAQ